MPPAEAVLILFIVSEQAANSANPALRAWLESERRFGVDHIDLGEKPPAKAAPPVHQPARAAERPTHSTPPHPPQNEPAPPALVARARRPQTLLEMDPRPELPPVCGEDLDEQAAAEALSALNQAHVSSCKHCPLHAHRTQTVFGDGRARPELVFVGEGPGADEDRQGVPFVGRAGQLLTRMIAAMTLSRDQVYICNIVKCRPPGNRTPTDAEMLACAPYLVRQLALLRPKVIVTLGRPATQTLLATKTPIGKLRGQFHDFPPPDLARLGLPTCKLMPTFHPAYLLRSPGEKGKAWDDLKQVMRLLGIPIPAAGRS